MNATPRRRHTGFYERPLAISLLVVSVLTPLRGQEPAPGATLTALKSMSIEELMDIEVTSASRRPERWFDAVAAIQVVSDGDIRRSAATTVTEALRLVPNLRVADVNSYGTVVSARGFSGIFTNKLLVLIDGRAVYTPLFGGVSWDVQNPLLEDIDRIESISGPAGTLWGANAVNGVINFTTKSAALTHGTYLRAELGSELKSGAYRYGSSVRGIDYRVHFARMRRDSSSGPTGADTADSWFRDSGGFRLDTHPTPDTAVSIIGDMNSGTEHTSPGPSEFDGQSLVARWTRAATSQSGIRAQFYFDRTWRDDRPSTFSNRLVTWDLDIQQSLLPKGGHRLTWGAGYRLQESESGNSTVFVGFVPLDRTLPLYSAYAQDEITQFGGRVRTTGGVRIEHNTFTGIEVQPSIRIAYAPSVSQTVWAAVSRAVRSPSRLDVDYHIPTFPVAPGTPNVAGGPDFESESVIAYELGVRGRLAESASFSLSTFYNDYDDVYSVEPLPGTLTYTIQNGALGKSWGAELAADWRPVEEWRLRAGYTFFRRTIFDKPGHSSDPSSLVNDPRHQVMVQSILDLPANFQLDLTGRYVSALPKPVVPGYSTGDVRLAWARDGFELAAVAQNLGHAYHPEFGTAGPRRSVHFTLTYRH